MRIKIDEYNPEWDGDILDRSKTAVFLTKYLDSLYGDPTTDSIYSSSFVLCINAEWGFGKTFLIKNWAEDLKLFFNYPVVYFDAWKHDFSDDPLLAFLSEFEQSLKAYKEITPKGKRAINKVVQIAKGAIAPTNLKSIAKIAIKSVAGVSTETVSADIADLSADVVEKYMSDALKSHNTRKTKIQSFSENLGKLLSELNTQGFSLPMYVFIDELDRCKPSYAIQLLEGIKHIFGTKGVFFIVATNKTQLSHSIQAIYGTEFDSVTYLQRFFDQEYLLEAPNYASFSTMLIQKYRLNNLNIEKLEMNYDFEATFSILAKAFSLSLRAQENVAKQLKAIVISNKTELAIHHWYLIFLTMLKLKSETVFDQINREGFIEKLKSVFDLSVFITARVEVTDHVNSFTDSKWDELHIMDIINLYKKYEKDSPSSRNDFFRGSTKGKLVWSLIEQGHFAQPSIEKFILKNYRRLVLQAGGLS